MVERILSLLKNKNLSPSQFADEIGIQRSGMSHLISGRNKPSLEFVMKVLQRFPDITAEWLLYGRTDYSVKAQAPLNIPASLFDAPEESAQTNNQGELRLNSLTPDHEEAMFKSRVDARNLSSPADLKGASHPVIKEKGKSIPISDQVDSKTGAVTSDHQAIRSRSEEFAERVIERIVVFYSDKTFREYKPEN